MNSFPVEAPGEHWAVMLKITWWPRTYTAPSSSVFLVTASFASAFASPVAGAGTGVAGISSVSKLGDSDHLVSFGVRPFGGVTLSWTVSDSPEMSFVGSSLITSSPFSTTSSFTSPATPLVTL